MIFYSVDQNNIYRKHEDVEPTPTVGNTIEVVFPNTPEYDAMQTWAQTNGSWVYFENAPLAGTALDNARSVAKVAIASFIDSTLLGYLSSKGIGRMELLGFGTRIRHTLANTSAIPVPLPANCSIIKDSLVSGVSCGDLMTLATDFDSVLDSLMGSISGYRRLAISEIQAAADQVSIDNAYMVLVANVQTFLASASFNSSF